MNYIEQYKKCYQAILREHEEVFQRLDMEQLKAFMDAIIEAKRIFVHGTGREGISARGFAMRLAHLGKQTYWLFDDTTVGMGEGDLFIITDGRGDVGIHRRIVEQASKTGAKIAFLTCLPEGNLVKKYAGQITSTKKITPHKLRSTYGTALYQETGDIYLVADVLGHKDVNTTRKHYAAQDENRRRRAAKAVRLRED